MKPRKGWENSVVRSFNKVGKKLATLLLSQPSYKLLGSGWKTIPTKNAAGVYLISDKDDQPLYVGMASELRYRIRGHMVIRSHMVVGGRVSRAQFSSPQQCIFSSWWKRKTKGRSGTQAEYDKLLCDLPLLTRIWRRAASKYRFRYLVVKEWNPRLFELLLIWNLNPKFNAGL